MTQEKKTITVEQKVLASNDQVASENRRWLHERGIAALNIISSPGAGKTTLLERTLEQLQNEIQCGVLVGDLQTDNDAQRMAGKGAPVKQIETVSSCHLDARRVAPFLEEVTDQDTRLLFIENVGNLICPATYDLGEESKIALLSITEGEDKPLKYPVIFSRVDLVLLTKIDLAPHLDWDRDLCRQSLQSVAPRAKVIELSAKSGAGMEEWLGYLRSKVTP